MPNIKTVPQIVNIEHYGGDTLELAVNCAAGFVNGRLFKAQLKLARTDTDPAATFTVTPNGPDSCTLMLPAATVADLLGMNLSWKGVWDCQVAPPAAPDPVTTLAQGDVTLTLDVTR